MDQHSSDHGDHGIHLPDPSFWPFVAGLGATVLSLALVWWSRDRTNQLAGPLLGASGLLTLISGIGWAYEDGRMKKKAEEGTQVKTRDARFTQVVTFAIAEGRMTASRATGGILASLFASDNALRDLAGFQDLRIIASPAEAGPSQVLVETTWSNREGLATYDETRRTLLDSVAAHPDDVLPGSVQVFDMEVVRDTKEMAFRFGMGPAAAVFGALLVFGLMVGAGLNLFARDTAATTAAPTVAGPAPAAANLLTATDNKFDKATLEAPPNTDVKFELKNAGKVKHNLHFLDKAGGADLAPAGKFIDGGQTDSISFKTPAAGTYYYQCDLHPDQMKGALVVKEGAATTGGATSAATSVAASGGSTASTGTSSDAIKVSMKDNLFDPKTLTIPAGKSVDIVVKNEGAAIHNMHILSEAKDGKDFSSSATVSPGTENKFTVKITKPGTYNFQCDYHVPDMVGTITVK